MERIAITGISGYIGTRLLEVLNQDNEIKKIVGIDIKEPKRTSPKLKFYKVDVSKKAELKAAMEGEKVDTVAHLAFVVDPIHDSARQREINVGGTKNFLECCHELGIKKVLFASSTSAYGAHPDNPPLLYEDSPLRGNEDFQYSKEKKELDLLCQEYMKSHPETTFFIVRPCIVTGPNIDNFISKSITMPIFAMIKGLDPVLQYVHEEDVAKVIYLLLKKGKGGIYNITGDGGIKVSECLKSTGVKVLTLPRWLAFLLGQLMWQSRRSYAPAGMLNFVMYPWLASNEKVKKELGYKFKYDSVSAYNSFLKSRGFI